MARNVYNILLQPLPVPKKSWVDVTLDFVTGLPKCHTYGQIYDGIFMVIDCLSKKCHYILCTKENKETLAEATAELFIRHVWLRKSLPIRMMSNRKPQFVVKM